VRGSFQPRRLVVVFEKALTKGIKAIEKLQHKIVSNHWLHLQISANTEFSVFIHDLWKFDLKSDSSWDVRNAINHEPVSMPMVSRNACSATPSSFLKIENHPLPK